MTGIPGEGKDVQSQLSSSGVAHHGTYASIPGFSSHLGEEFAPWTDVWSRLMPRKLDVNTLLSAKRRVGLHLYQYFNLKKNLHPPTSPGFSFLYSSIMM